MKAWRKWLQLKQRWVLRVQRAYRYSELRKLQLWLKGKTLHWALYLFIASLVLVGLLSFYNYLRSFLYVVCIDDREVGFVRDADEIEEFIAGLTEQCSVLYGMTVEPREAVSLQWDYRPGRESDSVAVKETLRQQVTLVTDAVMVVVEKVPVVPVASEDEVDRVVQILSSAYVSKADNVVLLEVTLLEEFSGAYCSVTPEEIFSADEAAALLMAGTIPSGRILLSRGTDSETAEETGDQNTVQEMNIPAVHVITVEAVTVNERIPYSTAYTYTSSLWTVQSRVLTPGKNGLKEVVYHVTKENGIESNREVVSETVLEMPVTQVVQKGTAAAPAMGTGQFIWPVEGGGRLTQGFRGWSHAGIDISYSNWANRYNTRILAADSGVVVETGSQYPMGNYIIIFHGNYFTVYLHHQTIFVSKGSTVTRGQAIGLMGNTGKTRGLDGIHLHFEIRVNDGSGIWGHWRQHQPVNPLNFFR
jgi:murein DD-endopeptidase MepM/ murein hydrolase activator NlpD